MSMKNMKRSETTEQIALFNWAKRTESILPELALMYHVPNEGKRSNGGILKAAGLKSGVPDICLPVANNGFHGLYIELKFGKNKATKAQEEYMAMLNAQGYKTAVCYGAEEAGEEILAYLTKPGRMPKKACVRMYAFKGDISKYFASIPHDKLKDENRRYIGDKKALMLMDDIIDHNGILPDGVGIPVGNLTSQLFANVYGNKLDKFCKHVLHIPYFVRYMDDFIILSDDLEQLKEWVKRIEEFLENEMLLHINPKSTILYAGNGIDFCGYIHYADHKKVRKSSIRKLKQDVKAYELGELPPEEFNRKYESRKGHLGHADTYHIAKAVEYELLFYEWEHLEATA